MFQKGMDEKDARIEHLENLISMLKEKLREPIAELFELHPADLK